MPNNQEKARYNRIDQEEIGDNTRLPNTIDELELKENEAATVIFSPGFLDTQDASGLFADIFENLKDSNDNLKCKMLDYYETGPGKEPISIERQAEMMQSEIDKAIDSGDKVVVIGHSQGNAALGYVDLGKVSNVVSIAPPEKLSEKLILDRFDEKRMSDFSSEYGMRIYDCKDGCKVVLAEEYLDSLDKVDPMSGYKDTADSMGERYAIIRLLRDRMLGVTAVNLVEGATRIDFDIEDHRIKSSDDRAQINKFIDDFLFSEKS